jgi:murein peptide amidase A
MMWLKYSKLVKFAIFLIAVQAINMPANSENTSKNEVFCQNMARHLPNVTQNLCMQANLVDTGVRSVKGVPLLKRDVVTPGDTPMSPPNPMSPINPANPVSPPANNAAITANAAMSSKMRVMVIGGIHGDELSSSALALNWIKLATQSPPNAISNAPASFAGGVHWRFIPMLNPDGLMALPAKRVNAHGVDLNRNFPTPNWARDAKIYWEQRTNKDPRRWPGPEPLSEPESKFLHDEMAAFKPHLIVSIHAPYGVLDFDGPTVPPSKLGRLYLDQVGIFPGSLGNYGGVHKGMPVVTIELPSAQRTPLDAETRQMWLDLLRWMGEKVKP